MKKKYRDNGAIGAILDEYGKVLVELDQAIINITNEKLVTIVDEETKDADCKSVQTILTHVINSGYNYVNEIKKSLGQDIDFEERKTLNSVKEYRLELKKMFRYTEQFLNENPNLKLVEHDAKNKILTNWGQSYDINQLLEHAIVHVSRHRRQIEIFSIQLNRIRY